MSAASFRALLEQGDNWLEQSIDTYRGGGGMDTAAAEAAIASAHYARAQLERPDTFAAVLDASRRNKAAQADGDEAARAAARDSGRHPAGRGLAVADVAVMDAPYGEPRFGPPGIPADRPDGSCGGCGTPVDHEHFRGCPVWAHRTNLGGPTT